MTNIKRGRPPVGTARAKPVSITLPPEYIDYLRTIDAELSAAVRKVVDRLRELETGKVTND